ncbi:MAG: hypothetical protein AABY16_04660 [Nanoarchaeota archaeon]
MEKDSKDKFVFDTSALISLGIASLIDKVLQICQIVVSRSVIEELQEFAKFNDKYGNVAKEVLRFKEVFSIFDVEVKEKRLYISETDNELYNLAKEKAIPLITDDIKLSRHVNKSIATYFSTYLLTALVLSGTISKEKALELLEQMKENRNWRNNIIYILSKIEIENL